MSDCWWSPDLVTNHDPDALFRELSNAGRWGLDDERGTLNHITPQKVRDAIGSVRSGRVVSIGRDLDPVPSAVNPDAMVHRMLYTGHEAQWANDSVEVISHGASVTHMDAVGHVYSRGTVYNGRRAAEVVTPQGMTFGSIMAMREGIVTRGILLDVAASRQVEYMEDEDVISATDLDAAEGFAGVAVESGDAVLVRSGRAIREERGEPAEPHGRAGLDVDAVRWLHQREVALYGGDCIERFPPMHPEIPKPLHEFGLAAMGLALLDWPNVEVLAAVCRDEGRSDFLLLIAPLRIPGGTASAVNPICVF